MASTQAAARGRQRETHIPGAAPTMPPEPGTLTGRTVAAVVITWESAVPDGRRRVAAVGRRVAALCAAGVDVAVISQATAARLSWPLWSQPLGAGHLLLSVSYGSELFEAGSGGLRLRCRRTGRSGRPDAMRDILGILAGKERDRWRRGAGRRGAARDGRGGGASRLVPLRRAPGGVGAGDQARDHRARLWLVSRQPKQDPVIPGAQLGPGGPARLIEKPVIEVTHDTAAVAGLHRVVDGLHGGTAGASRCVLNGLMVWGSEIRFGGDLRLSVAAWGGQAAMWYSSGTDFRSIRYSARIGCWRSRTAPVPPSGW